MKLRNHNIDFLKGCLIILVVIGHVIIGPQRETFARYFIYYFHIYAVVLDMPASVEGQVRRTAGGDYFVFLNACMDLEHQKLA